MFYGELDVSVLEALLSTLPYPMLMAERMRKLDLSSNTRAAPLLGISYKTADSHRSRILEKLGVHETASMVRYAIRAGLIEA